MVGSPTGFAAPPVVAPKDMVPIGGIIQWSGSVGSIPSNFALCDGNNGTPDLRGKFVIGAGGSYNPDDTGGSASPAGDVQLGGATGDTGVNVGSGLKVRLDEPLPPYYALAYIQRIS